MSGLTFPSFPCIAADAVKRTSVWRTKRLMSSSGKRSAAKKQTAVQYRYVISLKWLRQQGALTEVDQILALFNAVCGRWDTFTFTDPYDHVARVCEFETDELELQRELPGPNGTGGWWGVDNLPLITVL